MNSSKLIYILVILPILTGCSQSNNETEISIFKAFFENVIYDEVFYELIVNSSDDFADFKSECLPCNFCFVIDTILDDRLTPIYTSLVETDFVSERSPLYEPFERKHIKSMRKSREYILLSKEINQSDITSLKALKDSNVFFGDTTTQINQPCIYLKYWKPISSGETIYFRVVLGANTEALKRNLDYLNNVIISVNSSTGELKHYEWMNSSIFRQ